MAYTDKRILVETALTREERYQLKVRAVAEDTTVKEITTRAIRKYLTQPLDKQHKHD